MDQVARFTASLDEARDLAEANATLAGRLLEHIDMHRLPPELLQAAKVVAARWERRSWR